MMGFARAQPLLRLPGLLVCLAICNPVAAFAAAPTCVVKLKVSSGDKSDGGTTAFVKQILTGEGYSVIDDWLFTLWSASDYDVKITITYTTVPNYGFPQTLMGMQLFIADGSGNVIGNNYIDRANLEGDLRASIPACNASPPSTTPPNSTAAPARRE